MKYKDRKRAACSHPLSFSLGRNPGAVKFFLEIISGEIFLEKNKNFFAFFS
jgi:hypothetical protein